MKNDVISCAQPFDVHKKAIQRVVSKEYPLRIKGERERVYEYAFSDIDEGIRILCQTAYDARAKGSKAISSALYNRLDEAYKEVIPAFEKSLLHKAGLTIEKIGQAEYDRCMDYLHDYTEFCPPYEHYMIESINVNLLLSTNEERAMSHDAVFRQAVTLADPDSVYEPQKILNIPTGLSWLVEQQGYCLSDLMDTYSDFIKMFLKEKPFPAGRENINGTQYKNFEDAYESFCQNHSRFLASVCVELDNFSFTQGLITMMPKIYLGEYPDLHNEKKEIVFPKETVIGISDPWNMHRSEFAIELEKDLAVPAQMIYEAQIEGIKSDSIHLVNSFYNLEELKRKAPLEIRDYQEVKAPLDRQLKNATDRKVVKDSSNHLQDGKTVHNPMKLE